MGFALERVRTLSMSVFMTSPESITLRRPLDMHLHLRDGDMLRLVAPHSASNLAGAVIMPNLVPPITSVEMLTDYRDRILSAAGPHLLGPLDLRPNGSGAAHDDDGNDGNRQKSPFVHAVRPESSDALN